MSCLVTSPPVRDDLTRLEYLLQNLLANFTQVITLTASDPAQPGYIEKNDPSETIKEFKDRIVSIMQAIDTNIDLIPDSTLPTEELISCIEKLNQENALAASELLELEKIFDHTYKKARAIATGRSTIS